MRQGKACITKLYKHRVTDSRLKMIIPVRCFTCSRVLANKWEAYKRECTKLENNGKDSPDYSDGHYELAENFEKNLKNKILDKLGLDRACCRRHMLGHVDLCDII